MTRTPPSAGEVHLWQVSSDPGAATGALLWGALSDDERARASRFHTRALGERFAARRGWLRRVLGEYLDTDDAAIAFAVNERGKPRLALPRDSWLRFSVSHSGPLTVIAAGCDREVGVDVERVSEDFPVEDVARRFLEGTDREALAGVAQGERLGAFFAMWTRHEARLKAIGVGLGDDDLPPAADPRTWTVAAFDVGPGYAASVAVEGEGVCIPLAARALSAVPA